MPATTAAAVITHVVRWILSLEKLVARQYTKPSISGDTAPPTRSHPAQARDDEAALSFLGLGIPEPYPSWGRMLSIAAAEYAHKAPWLVIHPGLAISLAVFGTNLLGDALRDTLDPRLRGS